MGNSRTGDHGGGNLGESSPSQGAKTKLKKREDEIEDGSVSYHCLQFFDYLMASFREVRDLLLDSFDDGELSEDEFLLLYDLNILSTKYCLVENQITWKMYTFYQLLQITLSESQIPTG